MGDGGCAESRVFLLSPFLLQGLFLLWTNLTAFSLNLTIFL